MDIHIKETDCFGSINKDSISYDDVDYFGNSLILFELYKIKCFVKGNKGIIGIQLMYKFRENGQEYKSIDVKTNEDCTEQEFTFLPKEYITNIILWKKDKLIGFEITTDKNRIYRFGLDNGNKIMMNEFSSGKNIVVGFYTKFNINEGITAIGFYYIDKKIFSFFQLSGLFFLREKLKNQKYYDSINKDLSKLDKESLAVFKACLLPRNSFTGVLRYIIA